MSNSIRVSASAVVVRDGKLLLVKFYDKSGPHYNLPGGGAQRGESAVECCMRETIEETCARVTVGRLMLVREYEPERCLQKFGRRHKLNLIFACTLDEGSEPRMPAKPDSNQVGVEWIALDKLMQVNLVSTTLAQQLLDGLAGTPAGYVAESCD